MNKSTVLNTVRVIITALWRLALTAAVIAALCVAGITMVLNMIFFGPSESARDALTLTLLESELTSQIPQKFLGEELVAQINAGTTADVGISDPGLIAMGTADADEWSPYPEGKRTETVHGETYTATVRLYQDPDLSNVFWENTILAAPDSNHCKFGGVTDDGVLVLADTADALGATGIRSISVFECCQILMLDGQANEALLSGSSGYAPYYAVGQRADGVVICVTTNGWTSEYPGATYRDLINIMEEYGAVNACVLGSEG